MLVSILIPCYNAERWMAQAIESALAQTWPEKEIIVVNDGSTDNSLEVIKRFGHCIRWESGPNRGGNAARNRLLELARGEWLQYLDADDYLVPAKLSSQMDFLFQYPNTDIVFGPITLEHWSARETRQAVLPIPEPHDPWILLARWYLPQTGSPLWRKQAVTDVGGWKNDQSCCQEHELYLRLLMAEKCFSYCPASGAVYRQWGDHTVCKRNMPETYKRRLEIEQRAEDFLRRQSKLTQDRLWAINQARFEIARMAWLYDSKFASNVIGLIRRSQPDFVPGGNAAPKQYRILYQTLGFQFAEKLAQSKRLLFAR